MGSCDSNPITNFLRLTVIDDDISNTDLTLRETIVLTAGAAFDTVVSFTLNCDPDCSEVNGEDEDSDENPTDIFVLIEDSTFINECTTSTRDVWCEDCGNHKEFSIPPGTRGGSISEMPLFRSGSVQSVTEVSGDIIVRRGGEDVPLVLGDIVMPGEVVSAITPVASVRVRRTDADMIANPIPSMDMENTSFEATVDTILGAVEVSLEQYGGCSGLNNCGVRIGDAVVGPYDQFAYAGSETFFTTQPADASTTLVTNNPESHGRIFVLLDDGFQVLLAPGESFAVGTADPIPTVSEWGLIVLALLLLTSATLALRRQRQTLTV